MCCLLERCAPYEVYVREVSAIYEVSVRRVVRHMRCLLERCPPYEVAVREVSAI